LVDDVSANLGQAINIGFTRSEVSALNRVVKEATNAIAIIPIVLGCVDPALRSNAVRPTRTVVIAKTLNVISQLSQRGGRRSPGETGAYYDEIVLVLISWTDKLVLKAS
jgi:hypothetical protein